MPNWCQCTAVINAPKPVVDEIRAILVQDPPGLLNWMRPLPKDQEANWYDWCVTNWGTKWDLNEVFVGDDCEEDSITFSFDTAWAPPIEAFRHWAERDGRATYRLSYVEPGMGFVGWDSYDGEYFDDDYVEQMQDSNRYWQLAEQEFGMEPDAVWLLEPDEEPEPLTEWYTEGVREKGLE